MKSVLREFLYSNNLYSFFKGEIYDYKTLRNNEIFLSYVKNFNDKFEGALYLDFDEFKMQFLKNRVGSKLYNEIIEKFTIIPNCDIIGELYLTTSVNGLPYPKNISDSLKNFLDNYNGDNFANEVTNLYNEYKLKIREIKNSFGVKCFSSVPPTMNAVMWEHYANHYKGFCGEYEFKKIIYDFPSDRCDLDAKYLLAHCYKVKYVKEFKPIVKINCKKLLKISINELETNVYILSCIIKSLTIKQRQWGYEKEFRIILRNTDSNIQILDNTNEYGFKIEFPYLIKLYNCVFTTKSSQRKINSLAKNLDVQSIILKPSTDKGELEEIISLNNKIIKSQSLPTISYDIDDIPF